MDTRNLKDIEADANSFLTRQASWVSRHPKLSFCIAAGLAVALIAACIFRA